MLSGQTARLTLLPLLTLLPFTGVADDSRREGNGVVAGQVTYSGVTRLGVTLVGGANSASEPAIFER